MPINVKGSTDTTGAVSVLPKVTPVVAIVGVKGTGTPTLTANIPSLIAGTADASAKFGASQKIIDLVTILITNGVSNIKGVLAATSTPADYDTALTSLLREQANIIILDTTDPLIQAKLKAHLDLAEAEQIFRYGVVGAPVTVTDNAGFTTLAGTFNHSRMFLPGPHVLDGSGAKLTGEYAAAGLAALIATQTDDPALPMNGVSMNGFGGVERVLLSAEKDALVNGGVVPLTINGGCPTVYRLVTTYTKNGSSQTDPTWQEGTTRFIADDVLASCQARIKANYQRTKNVARIIDSIRGDIIDVLRTKEQMEIIENFNADLVSVMKDPSDLYGALVDYTFDVVTPLYTITIRQHMKL